MHLGQICKTETEIRVKRLLKQSFWTFDTFRSEVEEPSCSLLFCPRIPSVATRALFDEFQANVVIFFGMNVAHCLQHKSASFRKL